MAWAQESSQLLPGFAYLIKLDSNKTRLRRVCIFLLISGWGRKTKQYQKEREESEESKEEELGSLQLSFGGQVMQPVHFLVPADLNRPNFSLELGALLCCLHEKFCGYHHGFKEDSRGLWMGKGGQERGGEESEGEGRDKRRGEERRFIDKPDISRGWVP